MHSWPRPSVPHVDGTAPPLRIHDTAQGLLVESVPQDTARLYVCGITPYDATHLGHAMTYLTFDLLQRQWLDRGLDVLYTQNITDVDDPLLERAEQTGQKWQDIAERETELFRTDMTALRILPPQHYIGAVESIDLVVDLIDRLGSSVYRVDDDLYFRVRDDAAFGSLSHLTADEMSRIFAERGGDPERIGKGDPLDCLLWRAEREGEPAWDSPFGRGRPGWHIECSAIALAHLGTDFDVQGGGSDLVFPHHEMSASEARVATAEPFAQHFMHVGMVAYEGEKMSKSKGNLELVSRLRERDVDPMAIRLALLGHHYRSDWEWFDSDLSGAIDRLATWRTAVSRTSAPNASALIDEMRAALAHDLDAPLALTGIDRWAATDGDDVAAPQQVAAAIDALLGVAL